MRVIQQELICVGRFSVHLNVEASVFFSVHCTVQEGQTVSFDISPCELDVIVQSINTVCSVKASSFLILILTQVSSTYPINFSDEETFTIGDTREPMAQLCFCLWDLHCAGRRWSSDRNQVRHKCGLWWSWFCWTGCCPVAGISSQFPCEKTQSHKDPSEGSKPATWWKRAVD